MQEVALYATELPAARVLAHATAGLTAPGGTHIYDFANLTVYSIVNDPYKVIHFTRDSYISRA
jgi:hypothetical protein